MPVVDSSGRPVGVVSQTDLVRRERELPEAEASTLHGSDERWLDKHGYVVETPDYTKVKDIMTPAVVCADEDASVSDLARAMLSHHIHRIVILRAGRVKGIVTSMDLLRAMLILIRD